MIKLRRHPYLLLLPVLLACAESGDDSLGGGGQGGDASTVTTGGSTTSSTVGPTTTATTTTTTTTVTTTTSSSGGGGEGGEGGMMNEGGAPPAEYVLETEPNNTQGQANDLPDGAPGFAAEITSSNDFDVFAVEAVIGSTMTVTVSDGYGGCPSDATVNVQVFGPLDTEIAAESGLCPELDGTDPDLLSLADTGTYFIRVTAAQPVNSYAIDITVNPPVCGDGFEQLGEECDDGNLIDGDGCEADCTVTPVCGDSSIQVGEECDDGNTNDGDGCDSTCQFEGNVCPETEANNSIATANAGPTCTAWVGQIAAVGDVDYYAIPVTVAGSRIDAEVIDIGGLPNTCPSSYDSQLYLFDAGGTQLAYDDDDGWNACSVFTLAGDPGTSNLAVGTYYLAVHEYNDDGTSPPYRLRVNVIVPGCGDTILQAGEICDDGNLVDGDGCSSMCNYEAGPCGNSTLNLNEDCDDGNTNNGDGCSSTCTYEAGFCGESEPNNSQATADVIGACTNVLSVVPSNTDQDWFQIDVPVAGTDLRIEVTAPNSLTCTPSGDAHIYLHNSAGVLLGDDDDSGDGLCSLINPSVNPFATNLAAGTYYLRFQEHNQDSTVPLSQIRITYLP